MGVEPMWAPSPERVERANLTRYLGWLGDRRGLRFASYDELWRWSVDDLDGFWTSMWEFFEDGEPTPATALAERRMPGARWFPDATLNHAELSLRRRDDHPALLYGDEAGELGVVTYAELGRRVAAVAAGLRRLGVAKGDRVAAYLPNVPETVIALLAVASIGAVWSSCSEIDLSSSRAMPPWPWTIALGSPVVPEEYSTHSGWSKATGSKVGSAPAPSSSSPSQVRVRPPRSAADPSAGSPGPLPSRPGPVTRTVASRVGSRRRISARASRRSCQRPL